MRAVVRKLQIRPGHDFDLLLDNAAQVHALRRDVEKTVSRSSLLYAAIRTQPLVQAVLETNGLVLSTLERQLGFDKPPQLSPRGGDIDFSISENTTAVALMRYRESWPKRPLDALGTAAAILGELNGNVARHLRTAGLKADAARGRLEAFLNASPDGAIDASQSEFVFSGLVREVLDRAAQELILRDVAFPALSASSVLVALLHPTVGEESTAPAFLRAYVTDVNRDGVDAAFDAWFEPYEKGRESTSVSSYTQPLAAIFEYAMDLARDVSRGDHIAARHLVGAIVMTANRDLDVGSAQLLSSLGIDVGALASAFSAWLQENAPPRDPDDLRRWRRRLEVRDEAFLARFAAEETSGEDWLNIDDHVQAFATMIASDRISPPLAIGLFGDWGSGKSFFMAKLREAVAARAKRAQSRAGTPYLGKIVQIEFNAWHYVEANLWASLVENVFSNLKLTTGDDEKTIAERRAEVARRIDELIADRTAAEEKVQKAEVARERAANELDAKKKLAETSAAGLQGVRLVDAWDLVQIDPQHRTALETELKKLGLQTALNSKEDMRKTLDELREAGKRAELIGAWLRRRPLTLGVLAAIIVVTPLLTPSAVSWLRSLGLPDLNDQLAQFLAPLGSALIWIAARLRQANGIFDRIDAARKRIDAELQRAEQSRQTEIEAADSRLKAAVSEVASAKDELQMKEQDVEQARQALIELSSGRRLARFIDERAASDDYRKLLGVLATVRHDFSTLSRLMYPEKGEVPLKDEYRIDRIVLYIDDLDRCHPDRVVEVLQAVHLLLAFKLFVVVVGVDARWVSESLAQKHRALRDGDRLAQHSHAESSLIGYEAKPHDYLEKIFQVPFWLEPLDIPTAANYIARLLDEDIAVAQPGARPQMPIRGGGPAPASPMAQTNTGAARATKFRRRREEIDPEALAIAQVELDFMRTDTIAALVSRSPRTAKRFVNTYRFMRATVPSSRLDQYLAPGSLPEYQGMLLLLAIVVGAPDISLEIFSEMKKPEYAHLPLEAFAGRIAPSYGDDHPEAAEWRLVDAALRAVGDGKETVAALATKIDDVARYSFRPPYAQLALRKARRREPIAIQIVPDGASPADKARLKKAAQRPPS